MKDLLEVIESGREKLLSARGYNHLKGEAYIVFEKENEIWNSEGLADHLTSHTKAILTNQIERMKESKIDIENPPETNDWVKGDIERLADLQGFGMQVAHNQALQTQIDYLEEVISMLQ